MNRSFLSWSTGKDAMLALHHLQNHPEYSVDLLLTSLNAENDRVSMHGIPFALLKQQAENLGLPLKTLALHPETDLPTYNRMMEEELTELKNLGFTTGIYGDILLDDLRAYRETQMSKLDLKTYFPLWKKDTKELIHEFLDLGYKAIAVCINTQILDASFCGRIIDRDFINDLPWDADPCGENGEFHTFVFDGPLFQKPVLFENKGWVSQTYKPSNKSDKNCFTQTKAWDTQFLFADLRAIDYKLDSIQL